jgi:hypothetical protein
MCRRDGHRYRVKAVREGIVYLMDDNSRGWFGGIDYFLHDFEIDTGGLCSGEDY